MPGQLTTRLMLEAAYFSGGTSLTNHKLRGLGSILMLHRVARAEPGAFAPNAHLSVDPVFLEEVLAYLSGSIFKFASMDEAVSMVRSAAEGEKPVRPFVAVTLDDGYRDNLENAVPLFRKYRVPYTIYVAPGLVDGRATLWWEDLERLIAARQTLYFDWNGTRREFPLATPREKQEAFAALLHYLTHEVSEHEQRRIVGGMCALHGIDCDAHRAGSIMNWAELRELAKDPLCTLGAHTIGHYALARLPEKEAIGELEQSRDLIALETGRRPDHFAYPYGYPAAAGEREFALAARCGFASAVTTRHGVVYPEHAGHSTALPRISLNGNFQKLRYLRTMLSGVTTRLANKGRKLNLD
ncbi:MAG: polysaccharide deacetylase family protein [Nitratireductor sp.]|nr:polysaccharide deacetylase family protein [Nitratireductor sp.]